MEELIFGMRILAILGSAAGKVGVSVCVCVHAHVCVCVRICHCLCLCSIHYSVGIESIGSAARKATTTQNPVTCSLWHLVPALMSLWSA